MILITNLLFTLTEGAIQIQLFCPEYKGTELNVGGRPGEYVWNARFRRGNEFQFLIIKLDCNFMDRPRTAPRSACFMNCSAFSIFNMIFFPISFQQLPAPFLQCR